MTSHSVYWLDSILKTLTSGISGNIKYLEILKKFIKLYLPPSLLSSMRSNIYADLQDYLLAQFNSNGCQISFMMSFQFSSVQSLSCVQLCDSMNRSRPPCPSPALGVYPNSCPLSWWCHLTISSSVAPFSSCPQSFPASVSFQMGQLFASGGQSTGVSTLTSVLPMNTQDRFPLGWTGWISWQSKGLSKVFSNTTVQKHQFFGAQPSL